MNLASSSDSGAGVVVVWVILVALWFIPTYVTFGRRMPNSVSTFLLNLIPVAGFFIALVYACRSRPQPPVVVQAPPPQPWPGVRTEYRKPEPRS